VKWVLIYQLYVAAFWKPKWRCSIKVGKNILAIHGLNSSTISSDFLISVVLEAAKDRVLGQRYRDPRLPGGGLLENPEV